MPSEAHDYEKLRESILKLDLHASKNWRILEFPNDPENFFVQADRLSQAHPYDIEVLGDDKHPELYPNLVARSDAELLVLLRNSLPAILSALSLAADAGRVVLLEQALWKVVAYDQLLRKIGSIQSEPLFAGQMPNVDAAYDDMVKTVIAALASQALQGEA